MGIIIRTSLAALAVAVVSTGLLCTAQTSQPNLSVPASSAATSAASEAQIASLLRAGQFQEAQSQAQAILTSRPNDATAWAYFGLASAQLGEARQAAEALERAISLNPKEPRPYFDVALVYASTNQPDKAIERYRNGLALDNHNGTAYYNYGRLLTTRERFPEAVNALKRAVEINRSDTDARLALVEALLRARRRREAAGQAHAFLEMAGVPTPALVSLGGLLVEGGELELARTVLSQALSVSPNSVGAHLQLSKLCLALNDYPGAIRAARRGVELTPGALEPNLALAEALISARQDSEAEDLLMKVEPQFQKSAPFQYTLGIARFRAKHFVPAIAAFKQATELDPSLDLAYFLLGQSSLNAGELDEAETNLKAAIRLKPRSTLYYNHLAQVYEQKGSGFHQAAMDITKKVLALDPKDIESRERLAKWAKEEGDLPRARQLLEAVVAEAPAEIPARVLLASVYYRLNRRKEGDEQTRAIRALEAEAQKHQVPQD